MTTGPTYHSFEKDTPPGCKIQSHSIATRLQYVWAFSLGLISCFLAFHSGVLSLLHTRPCSMTQPPSVNDITTIHSAHSLAASVTTLGSSVAGSTVMHDFPPENPKNAHPSLFPTDVGFSGHTRAGGEAALVATAPQYPIHPGQCGQLVSPTVLEGISSKTDSKQKSFNIFRKWGNLSPWYGLRRGHFGVDSSPDAPGQCRVTGLHLLHRHGARYPTSRGPPAQFARKLNEAPETWNATDNLEFLNDWTYKLGEEVLTPFGRQQLYDLGVSMRLKYGNLLQNFSEVNTIPVFRTGSQHRMLDSSINFALGYFGHPLQGKYQQSIGIEARGYNNTLASIMTCKNLNKAYQRGDWYFDKWIAKYLKSAQRRLSRHIIGFDLTIKDVYAMQHLCAYETVALGYSRFCEIFTTEDWEGFEYSIDLWFWYVFGFGSPIGRALGIGYVQELVARLTHTPISIHNSTTNSTLNDNPITFPLDQSIYVDTTHDTLLINVITALNLTTFAKSGPLPYTHILHERQFHTSEISPFAGNIQFQVLDCLTSGSQIRIIINDGVVPLHGVGSCPKRQNGMCPLEDFVKAQKEMIATTDWNYGCNGDWMIPDGMGWETVTGDPPAKVI